MIKQLRKRRLIGGEHPPITRSTAIYNFKAAEYLEGLGIDAAENEVDAENGGEETEEIILR